MQCTNNDIQELLPAYEQQLLDRNDRSRVEKHLAACEDCARELAMIRMLADEPVPDPGEAFWTALPGKVYREVREQDRQKRSGGLMGLLDRVLLPRWAWAGAAAAVLLVAAVSWFLVHPRPGEIASTAPPDTVSPYEDMLDAESVDMAELDDTQLDSLDSWAARELASLQETPGDLFTSGFDASTDDKLAELNEQELEDLSNHLDEYEEEG
jgi:hypothetical protein